MHTKKRNMKEGEALVGMKRSGSQLRRQNIVAVVVESNDDIRMLGEWILWLQCDMCNNPVQRVSSMRDRKDRVRRRRLRVDGV